jgi:hypothetical protein
MLGQAAQQDAYLLPFLGEQFSIKDIIYEGEEWEEVGMRYLGLAIIETKVQPPLLPHLCAGPGCGYPMATSSAAPATWLHPQPDSPSRVAYDAQGIGRPRQGQRPAIRHL